MNEWKEPAFADAFPAGAQRVCEFNEYGSYAGNGAAIALLDGKFLLASYSHCSCRGAAESMGGPSAYDNFIDALRALGSVDLKDMMQHLTDEARLG